uniref:Uncharacterized protein n=1 Tax=Oryza brachyantha TaxID=4533 RepID=J3MYW6_ORYBR
MDKEVMIWWFHFASVWLGGSRKMCSETLSELEMIQLRHGRRQHGEYHEMRSRPAGSEGKKAMANLPNLGDNDGRFCLCANQDMKDESIGTICLCR